jgi:hypothetical protein
MLSFSSVTQSWLSALEDGDAGAALSLTAFQQWVFFILPGPHIRARDNFHCIHREMEEIRVTDNEGM